MPSADSSHARTAGVWRWRTLAALLIVGAAGLHLAYLAFDCPLDLVPDEAHYWDWSRHLDWSYYSKGPLVAYLIRASCALSGSWSLQLTDSHMLAVRLPAVLCASLLLVSLYVLTAQVYHREGLSLAVVALTLTSPVMAAGASLMTIDAPYTCCWGWALVLGQRAIFRHTPWAWPALGLVIGLGILAKYTMVLWIPSVALFLLTTPAYRRQLLRPGFWIMSAVAGACCLPLLLWNLQHDWVSVRHVLGQAGFESRMGVRWWGPLEYVGLQCALLLGFWFVAWAAAMVAYRPWRVVARSHTRVVAWSPDHATAGGVGFLWWMSAPTFVVFLLFSLKTAEEPNWPITAYLSGLVLAAAWLSRQIRSRRTAYRNLTLAGLAGACCLGLGLTTLLHHSEWFQPMLLRIAGPPTAEHPLPLRRFDPTCRLRGWRVLAAEVDRLRADLRARGTEPLLAGSSWTLPGELAFYCRGNPTVYSFGLALGDRHSQYDLWQPNPVNDGDSFKGKTFIFVGEIQPSLREAFQQVDTPLLVTYCERGQPIAHWTVTVCRGFRGFRNLPEFSAKQHF